MKSLFLSTICLVSLGVVLADVAESGDVLELRHWMLSSELTRQGLFIPHVAQRSHFNVTVPNTVFGGLLQGGHLLVDPMYGKNFGLYNHSNFSAVSWRYETEFVVEGASPSQGGASRVILDFHGVSYRANVTVNGVRLSGRYQSPDSHDDMIGTFRRFAFDITDLVLFGSASKNSLQVDVTAPVDHVFPWMNNSTDLAITFVDWNPEPADQLMGLWRPVYIRRTPFVRSSSVEGTKKAKENGHIALLLDTNEAETAAVSIPVTVDGVNVKTTDLEFHPNSPAEPLRYSVQVHFVLTQWAAVRAEHVSVSIEVQLGGFITFSVPVTLHTASHSLPSEFHLNGSYSFSDCTQTTCPSVWWPYQMAPGQQNLHAITLTVKDLSLNRTATQPLYKGRFGVRTSEASLDEWGNRQFHINGKHVLIRGGGWSPDIFLREQPKRLRQELEMVRDMGLNAIRLEGKMQSKQFFDWTDELGIMVLPGWCCCDAWQKWPEWGAQQYDVARESMRTQGRRLSIHPSVIVFLISSDWLPPQNVEALYLDTLKEENWPNPTISAASQAVSNLTGSTGVKMSGPYSWVPPNYWLLDVNASEYGRALGGAWGFLTEGGPGEAPMTYSSWVRTTPAEHLWDSNGALGSWWDYHCGNPQGHFGSLHFYVPPLDARYGVANSALVFTYMSQAANYEGIRAMFEGYSRNKRKGATGVIQWMMNNAWPSNIWNLFDYYLQAGGGYYGAKKACKSGLHPVYSYNDGSVWVVNSGYNTSNSAGQGGSFWVLAEIVNLNGETIWQVNTTSPIPYPAEDSSFPVGLRIPFGDELPEEISGTYFLKLSILQENSTSYSSGRRSESDGDLVVLTDNWYWLSRQLDVLNWTASRWFRTPCSAWANFTGLLALPSATIDASVTSATPVAPTPFDGFVLHQCKLHGSVTNVGKNLAFFVELFVESAKRKTSPTEKIPIQTDTDQDPSVPHSPPLVAVFSDNYITLRPGEAKEFEVIVTLDHLYDEPAATGSSSMTGPTESDCAALFLGINTYNNVVSGNA